MVLGAFLANLEHSHLHSLGTREIGILVRLFISDPECFEHIILIDPVKEIELFRVALSVTWKVIVRPTVSAQTFAGCARDHPATVCNFLT